MPVFRQIEASIRPQGYIQPGPRAAPIDISPIASGLMQAQHDFDRQAKEAERQRKELEAEQKRQAEDEARISVSNITSQRLATLTESLQAAETSPEGMAGATARALKDHETWVKETEKTLSPEGQQLFAIQANNIGLRTHESFFKAETVSRQARLVSDYATGVDAAGRMAWSDPAQYTDALARVLATADTLNVPADVRAKMKDTARDAITTQAAMGLVRTDPEGVLKRLGYEQRMPEPGAPAKSPSWIAPAGSDRVMGVNTPVLTDLVMQAESGGKRYGMDGMLLASAAGAKGEMQVMDATNADPGFGVRPAANSSPDERARVGRDYLAAMVSKYGGNVPMALAAYNAGPGAVDSAVQKGGDWLGRLPTETQNYVAKITKQYADKANIKPGSAASADLATGGATTSPVASSGYGPGGPAAPFDVSGDPVFGNLPPEKLDTIANHALTIVRQKDAAARAALSAQQAEGKDLARGIIAALSNGYAQDPTLIDRAKKMTAGTATYGDIIQAEQAFKVTGQFRTLPPDVQADQLIASQPRATTPEAAALHQTLTKVAADAKAELKRDAFSYGSKVLGLTPAPIDTSSVTNMVPGLSARLRQSQQIGAWAKQTVPVLTEPEAEAVGKTLAAMNAPAKAEAVAQLYGTIGPQHIPALVQQIDKTDKGLALGMAAGSDMTTQGRRTAELIFKGQQAIKDKSVKEDSGAMTGLRANIAKEVGDSLAGTFRDNVIDAARMIYLGAQSEGHGISESNAVRLAIGGDIITHNGKRIPVPMGLTDESIRDAVVRAAPSLSSQAPDGKVSVGGSSMALDKFIQAVPDAVLEPAGMGRYYIRAGGSLAKNSNGQELTLRLYSAAP